MDPQFTSGKLPRTKIKQKTVPSFEIDCRSEAQVPALNLDIQNTWPLRFGFLPNSDDDELLTLLRDRGDIGPTSSGHRNIVFCGAGIENEIMSDTTPDLRFDEG